MGCIVAWQARLSSMHGPLTRLAVIEWLLVCFFHSLRYHHIGGVNYMLFLLYEM